MRLAGSHQATDLRRAASLAAQASELLLCEAPTPQSEALRARSLVLQGLLLIELAEYDDAAALADQALSISESMTDAHGQLRAMFALSYAELRRGNYPEALELELKQLDIANRIDADDARANAFNGIGVIYSILADYQEALGLHDRAAELFGGLGNIEKRSIALSNSSMAARRLGQLNAALEYGLESLRLAEENDFSPIQALINAGESYARLERYEEAQPCLVRALALAVESGRRLDSANASCTLGEIASELGQFDDALVRLLDTLQLAQSIGARMTVVRSHAALANVYKALGNFETALAHCEAHYQAKEALYLEQSNARLRRLEIRHRTDSASWEAEIVREKTVELEHINYAISHDLKGPLLTVRAFADLLAQDLLSDDQERVAGDLEWIRSAAATMQERITQLTKLSRESRNYEWVNVDFADVVRDVINLLGGPISERGSLVDLVGPLPVVKGDVQSLTHLVQNLVENALKFCREGTTALVEIGVREATDPPVLYVSDNGIGVEQQYREKIFQLFERLNHQIEGSGVGLALAKRIVSRHHGEIWVEDNQRDGSTFCFTLGARVNCDALTPQP